MPTLMGHVVPGALLMVFGLWWCLVLYRTYFRAKLQKRTFRMTATRLYGEAILHPTRRLSPLPPWEASIKIVGLMGGVLGELFTSFDEKWHFFRMHSIQHMTIFSLFAFPSLFELLYYYRVPLVPPGLDLVAVGMAFGVQALSFAFHLHGRSTLDITAHTFLIYGSLFVVVAVLFELIRPRDIRPHLIRCCLVFAQGVWYVVLGAVLYPPSESWPQFDPESHANVMIVTAMFVWSVPLVAILQLLLGVSVYRSVKQELIRDGVRVFDKFVSYEIALEEEEEVRDLRLDDLDGKGGYAKLCQDDTTTLLEEGA